MATRIPNTPRLLSLGVAVPPGMSDEIVQKIIKDSLAEAAKKTAGPAIKVVPLRNRSVRHKGTFPCTKKPDRLHMASVLWPLGAPKQGCGRTFATERRRDLHEKGSGWSPKRFPNGCLDSIIPMNLRETR